MSWKSFHWVLLIHFALWDFPATLSLSTSWFPIQDGARALLLPGTSQNSFLSYLPLLWSSTGFSLLPSWIQQPVHSSISSTSSLSWDPAFPVYLKGPHLATPPPQASSPSSPRLHQAHVPPPPQSGIFHCPCHPWHDDLCFSSLSSLLQFPSHIPPLSNLHSSKVLLPQACPWDLAS